MHNQFQYDDQLIYIILNLVDRRKENILRYEFQNKTKHTWLFINSYNYSKYKCSSVQLLWFWS